MWWGRTFSLYAAEVVLMLLSYNGDVAEPLLLATLSVFLEG